MSRSFEKLDQMLSKTEPMAIAAAKRASSPLTLHPGQIYAIAQAKQLHLQAATMFQKIDPLVAERFKTFLEFKLQAAFSARWPTWLTPEGRLR